MARKNQIATIDLPSSLLIISIVVGVSIALLILGFAHLQTAIQTNHVKQELGTLCAKAELLSSTAFEETSIVQTVSFPSCMHSLIAGAVPDASVNHSISRDNQTASSLCVLYKNGERFIKHSTVKYCGFSSNDYAVLPAGSYDVRLTVMNKHGETYVQINKI